MNSPKLNIREIAKIAGVSVASVSRALQSSPSPYISEKQRKRILDICAEFHYQPNEHTRRMLSNKADTMALLFPPATLNSPDKSGNAMDVNFGACMLGAQKALAEHGINLLLTEVSKSFIDEKRYLKMVRGKMIDGILIWGIRENDDYIHELLREEFPVVMLQNEKENCHGIRVIADDYNGMAALTEKVIAAGHRKIAIARPSLTASTGRERLKGILDTLKKHKISPHYQSTENNYGYKFGKRAAAEVIRNAPDTTCIIASNDMAAWGCIEKLSESGIQVPDDISITGADGIFLPGKQVVDSFYSPSYEIGRTGAELLLKKINGEDITERNVLPIEQVEGNTVKKIGKRK